MTDSEKMDLILAKLDGLDQKVDGLDQKVDGLDQKVDGLEQKVDIIDNDVKDTKLILENEIRVNIQRVAEGHLDLSRNLHNAMKPSNELEMLAIKVSMLESDMRELKRKVS